MLTRMHKSEEQANGVKNERQHSKSFVGKKLRKIRKIIANQKIIKAIKNHYKQYYKYGTSVT